MNDSNDFNRWIEYAKNDLLVTHQLEIEKHFVHREILTHSQQSIEKYLKAFLLFQNQSILRTHDLLVLCRICGQFDQEFLNYEKNLSWISISYLQSRYPDNFEDIDIEDAKRSLEIATKFEKFILPKFGLKK